MLCRRFVNNYPDYQIFNLDAPTYGNLENIADIEAAANYTFIKGILLMNLYQLFH
jgi:dTDP-glucose 4,6-dehydratase